MKNAYFRILFSVLIGAVALAAVGYALSARTKSPLSGEPPVASGPAVPELPGNAAGLDGYFKALNDANSAVYTVQSGDTLTKISKLNNVTIGSIMAANGMTSDALKPGMKLKIMREPWSIVVDKQRFTLELLAGATLVKAYRIGIGKDNSTPVGEFKIASRLKNPTWYHDGKVLPFGHPENPLGTRWMGFDLKSYGVHGTIAPESIGKAESLGCIRMLNTDVEELYELVPVGAAVRIVESRSGTA